MSPFPAARPLPWPSCGASSPRSARASGARAMELSLAFIGWFFTLICAGALALGAALIAIMARAGDLERRYLSYSIWNDLLLAAIWVLGLVGGIVELFCWALIVLAPLSAASRLYAFRRPQPDSKPVNWLGAIAGVTLILIPILTICGATIATLRSPETLKAFSAN